jgi:hypothetical protein
MTSAWPDEPVMAYLTALEARRAATDTLPHPDQPGPALAKADMMHGGGGDDEAGDGDDDEDGGQEGEELSAQLAEQTPGSEDNVKLLEDAFVAAAPDYGRRHRIGYAGWIEAGVDPAVLERAGIRPDDS